MSEDTRVLIVGDPQDPVTRTLVAQCREARCQVTTHPDYQIYDLSTRQNQHIIFYNYPVHYLSDQVFAKAVVHPYAVIFLSSYSDWAAGKLLPEHEGQVLAFSALGMYADKKVIEVGATLLTKPETVESGRTFLSNMGFTPYVMKETPGFVFPRIFATLVNEAVSALMEGVSTPEDIDTAMKLGTNYPEGPLAWADRVGLDVVLEILEHLHNQIGEDRYRPMTLLTQKVLAGHLGQKSGKGFYEYQAETAPAVAPA